MIDLRYMHVSKWRFIIVGMFMLVSVFLLSTLLPGIKTSNGSSLAGDSLPYSDMQGENSYDGPNFIANAISSTEHEIRQATGKGFRSMINGVAFIIRAPGKMFGFVTHTNILSAAVRPIDHTPVPVIDSRAPALLAAQKAMPVVQPKAPAAPQPAPQTVTPAAVATTVQATIAQVDSAPQWPLHGAITTEFGVPELPYEAIHTGLDISDGRVPGITPIKSFRPGQVLETIRSNGGLGNHVIVDHGSGVTSVYGHLNSIAVEVGQMVDIATILGYEGTTGASTGNHLHFEIRVNGRAANPHQFITGNP